MTVYRWLMSGFIGVMTGVGVQMWFGVWGLLAGMIVFLLVFVGSDLVERWQRRKYRLTREQAFRLHRQMLDYATTDAWRSSIIRR